MERKNVLVGEELLVFACRWAMGKPPPFSDICANHVIALWDSLSPGVQKTLLSEIELDLARGIYSSPAFMEPWIKVLRLEAAK